MLPMTGSQREYLTDELCAIDARISKARADADADADPFRVQSEALLCIADGLVVLGRALVGSTVPAEPQDDLTTGAHVGPTGMGPS